MIMGRKTYESLGRPLPSRTNIVVTRQKEYRPPGAEKIVFGPPTEPASATNKLKPAPVYVVSSIQDALDNYEETDEEVFIIGGGEIFELCLPIVDKMYITVIEKEFSGDSYFPKWSESEFALVSKTDRQDPIPFSFRVYQRIKPASLSGSHDLSGS